MNRDIRALTPQELRVAHELRDMGLPIAGIARSFEVDRHAMAKVLHAQN